ncbi:MAG: LysM peptidoglycan-binding domain-containing protein [Anaerovoracaceae bacterium]
MKKYRIRSSFRFTVSMAFLIVSFIWITGSFYGYFDATSIEKMEFREYKVQTGDTLWDIAKEYGSEKTDCRQTIYEISKINQVTPETLYAGSTILIPANK